MKTYAATIEVRERGAIGIFELRTYRIEAISQHDAALAALEQARAAGLETRFPSHVDEVKS